MRACERERGAAVFGIVQQHTSASNADPQERAGEGEWGRTEGANRRERDGLCPGSAQLPLRVRVLAGFQGMRLFLLSLTLAVILELGSTLPGIMALPAKARVAGER